MKQWEELSQNALNVMRDLGNFGPTIPPSKCEVKGYMLDAEDGGASKTYLDADNLRDYAEGLCEVADWLEERAAQEKEGEG